MVKRHSFVRALAIICVIAIFTTACTAQERQNISQKQAREDKLFNEQGNLVLPMQFIDSEYYVPAQRWIDSMEYNATVNDKELSLGYTDELFHFTADSKQAKIGEQQINLQSAPIWHNDQQWFPASLIEQAFEKEAQFEIKENQIILRPSATRLKPFQEEATDNDDIIDEFFAEEEDAMQQGSQNRAGNDTGFQMQSSARDNPRAEQVIARASRYLGVPYKFGAAPYAQSQRFDCSSFVQHVFRPSGIHFPRTSRNQANKGYTVSRQNLRRGDLLYFYVPGRFSTNRTIGHVGIYIGNGNMVHSSPAPKDGVQVTSIHKKYWKDTFVTAKRVL